MALRTGLLLESSRFLTLSCSCDLIGGLDSPAGAVRSLVLSSELVYQHLRRLSLNSAVDVMHFTFRLEEMLGCYADELLGTSGVDIIEKVVPGFLKEDVNLGCDATSYEDLSTEIPLSPEQESEMSANVESSQEQQQQELGVLNSLIVAPVRSLGIYSGSVINSVGGQIMSASPTLSYLVGGGIVWSVSKTLNSIDSLRYTAGKFTDGDYFGGNVWCGPDMKGFIRLRGPVSLRGPLRLRGGKAGGATVTQRRGVVISMPVCTGYSWSAYTYMDGYYGPLGIERLFHSRLFSMALLAHLLKSLIKTNRYCSCATISLSTIPVTTESRSAFFRLLCNIHDSASGYGHGGDLFNDDPSEASASDIVESLLRSFRVDTVTYQQLQKQLNQPLSSNYLNKLCKPEFYMDDTSGNQVITSLPSEKASSDGVENALPSEIRDKIDEMRRKYGTETSAHDFSFTHHSSNQSTNFSDLILGMFSAFLLINRRDVAAVVAVILLKRIDIACLCLKKSALSHEESIRLLKFSVGVFIEESSHNVETTLGLFNAFTDVMRHVDDRIIVSELLPSVIRIIADES